MKRKSRKSVQNQSKENYGDSENTAQNYNEDEYEEEEPESEKRKSSKRKSSSTNAKKAESLQEEEQYEVEDQYEEEEPESEKRKSSKRKSSSTNAKKAEPVQEEEQYEVEAILDEKYIKGVRHYLIRWKGYEPESDTWEPESTLNCAELITEFKAKQKKKKRSSKPPTKRNGRTNQQNVTWDENENFEVDRILDVYFKRNGKREFLVSWKGYPQSQNSWEPEDNMDCKDLIEKFMAKVERAKMSDQRELRVKRAHTDRFTLSMDSKGRRLSKRYCGKQRVQYHDAE